ncbi:MAG: type VII secretion protein EssC, partial [Ruminococcus sp.]|nr:type VII secretion protein EssC [Ruminococcus sp.]
MKNRETLNFSLLTSFGMYNYNNSDFIIELTDESSKLYDRANNIVSEFSPYVIDNNSDFETYLNRIANIKLDINTEKYQLPKMLTFLDMFRVSKVEHLNSLTRWAENNPIKSLKTEIGVAPSGDTFFIDMHEKFHGPHGLIAGTTGSGKSESIITVILSLAVNYSPEEVAFVIVDYKGGGLADAFNDVKEEIIDGKSVEVHHKLPHVVGTVTNLDGSTIERARISIETEIKRRQFLFKKARKISNEGTMDIYKYQQLRREGADLEALPHLFIVCDEFAELKDDRPDFMDLLVSAARIGRSLGVHLVLATQKPDTVVSPQIWSNSRFKICLKVQGKDDSNAVIHCPDAAEIYTTGRFFFQVGYNEVFSMGQSAWCGADYIETEEFVKNDIESVEVISNTGTVIYEKVRKPEIKINPEKDKTVSQLIAVREYLIDIAKDIDIRSLWLDPIPAKLSIRELYAELGRTNPVGYVQLEPVIGKKDDLYERKQEIMTIQFSKKGNLAVYGAAGSGLDMFFITLIYSLIYDYTPEQVNIYVLDFDAGFLKTFAKAPHIGDVAIADEEEEVKNIISSIRDEIVRRSKLFAEQGG